MKPLTKIMLYLRIDKIIDSINRWRKDTNGIKIRNRISTYKNLANYSRVEGLDKVGDYFDKKANNEKGKLNK